MNSDYNQDWIKRCMLRLAEKHCFLSTLHKARYERVLNAIYEQPFFGRDIAKCSFLATACDQTNDNRFEATLQTMIEKEVQDSSWLLLKLKARAKELNGNEKILNRLAMDLLIHPDETPDESCLLKLSRAYISIGECTLAASDILNTL